MTTPHRTLQMALDALDAITDDVDGTGLNTMPSFDKAIDAITALREALSAPEPEPVALESVHLTRDTRGMCVVRVNGRVAIRDNGDIIDHMATLEWFAAPPAAPAPAAPVVREPLTTKQLEVVIYDHTKLNPNQADDRELIDYIVNAIRAIEAAHGITGGKP